MSDLTLKCSDCQNGFTFTEREQLFFQEKGFAPPKRCKDCRQAKKNRFNNKESSSNGSSRQQYAPPADFAKQWINGSERPANPRKQHGARRGRDQQWRRGGDSEE